MKSSDGSVQDAFVVWEGGDDIATCKDLNGAARVAKALRLEGSVENIWITKGPEFETVYDDPRPKIALPGHLIDQGLRKSCRRSREMKTPPKGNDFS